MWVGIFKGCVCGGGDGNGDLGTMGGVEERENFVRIAEPPKSQTKKKISPRQLPNGRSGKAALLLFAQS